MIQRLQVRLAHMHFPILMRSTSTTHDSTVLLSAPIKNTANRYIRKKLTRSQDSLPKRGVEKLDKEEKAKDRTTEDKG